MHPSFKASHTLSGQQLENKYHGRRLLPLKLKYYHTTNIISEY